MTVKESDTQNLPKELEWCVRNLQISQGYLYLAFPTLESSNNTADEALLMLPTLFNYITIYFRQTLALYRSLL